MMTNGSEQRTFNKKKAWVFGGTSDIGRSIISVLHAQGFDITFTWNSNFDSTEAILKNCPNTQKYKLDLSSESEVNDFCNREKDALVSNLIVYCAGVNNATFCDDLELTKLDSITRINFISAAKIFNSASQTVKPNKSLEAKFVYISSIAARKVSLGNTLYGATKAAMERYFAGLAVELARFNVRTLCISPGYVKTKMLESYCSDKGFSLRDLQKHIPTRKFLGVDDISSVTLAFALGQIVTTGEVITLGNGERFM